MRERDVLALLPLPSQPPREIDCADTVLREELRVAVAVGLAEGGFTTLLPRDRSAPGAAVRRRFTGRLTAAGAAALAEAEEKGG